MSLPKLIYFATRGRAELIRLILAEADVAYEEENFAPDAFAALKASGRLPFNAVPVWQDPDGFRLAQSVAIATYLARSHGLYGGTLREHAECDQMIGAFEDVRAEFRKIARADPSQRRELREELASTILPGWFDWLDRLLGANRGGEAFLVGDSITMADLALWYLLEMSADNGFVSAFASHPRLEQFAQRIRQRPRIAGYLASPRRFPVLLLPK
jgi:glutathione S-transferase